MALGVAQAAHAGALAELDRGRGREAEHDCEQHKREVEPGGAWQPWPQPRRESLPGVGEMTGDARDRVGQRAGGEPRPA